MISQLPPHPTHPHPINEGLSAPRGSGSSQVSFDSPAESREPNIAEPWDQETSVDPVTASQSPFVGACQWMEGLSALLSIDLSYP